MPARFARTPRATHGDEDDDSDDVEGEDDQNEKRRAKRAAVACEPVRVQGLRPLRDSLREPWTRPGPRSHLLYRGDGEPSPRGGDDEGTPGRGPGRARKRAPSFRSVNTRV